MNQFTPGPWRKRYDQSEDAIYVEVDEKSICRIDLPEENDDDNARLIAAAPAVYEALKDILPRYDITADGECKFCGRDYGKDIPKDYLCTSEDCPAEVARAALALVSTEEQVA